MSRRDVELVIKARDEAKAVLNQITQAVKQFSDSQRGLDERSKATGSTLDRLKTSFTALESAMQAVGSRGNIGQKFDAAKASADRLDQSVQRLSNTQRQQERDLSRTTQVLDRYAAKLRGAEAALTRQRDRVEQAKASQDQLQREYTQSAQAAERLQRNSEALVQSYNKKAAAVAAAEARLVTARNALGQAENATRGLVRAQADAERAVSRTREAFDRAKQALQANFEATQRQEQAQARLAPALQRATQEFSRQNTALDRIKANQQQLSVQTSATATAQTKLQAAVARTGNELARAQGPLAQARQEMAQLSQTSEQADRAVQQLALRGIRVLRDELARQRQTLTETRAAYQGMTDVVSRMAAEIGRVGVPTRQMAADFDRAKVSAAQAKQEFLAQQTAVQQLVRAYQQKQRGIDGVQAAQQRFTQVLNNTRQAMAASAEAANRKRAALAAMAGSTGQASSGMQQVAGAARNAGGAARTAAGGVTELRNALNQLYGGSRQSLSFLQRLRGELLALTAAYTGFFAAFNEVGNIVQAIQTLEAAQSRLNVIFEGDTARQAKELDFIRRNADRLGISFGDLADLYTKFAVASKGTNLEGQATRDIFIAVAEAARVNKAPLDKIRLTFLALEQMVSKGTVSMEELRRQLGDQLPGAFGLMAEAAARAGLITDKFATDELTKLIETGQLSSDILTEFADVLRDRFSPGLELALESTTTAIGRLQNAVFQTRQAIGQGQFEQQFINTLNTLTQTLQSPEFVAFAQRIGQALALIARGVEIAIQNWRILVAVIAATASGPVLLALGAIVKALAAKAAGAKAAALAWRGIATAQAAATVATTTATGAVAANGAAVAATASRFGPWGLAIGAVVGGLTFLATRASTASQALADHGRVVDQVKDAYEAAAGDVEKFRERIRGVVTETDLQEVIEGNVRAQEQVISQAVRRIGREFGQLGNLFGRGVSDALNEYREVWRQFQQGEISALELRDAIQALNEKHVDGSEASKRLAQDMNRLAREALATNDRVRDSERALTALTGEADEAERALDELTGRVREFGGEAEYSAKQAEVFAENLAKIENAIPGLSRELDFLNKTASLEEAFSLGSAAAQTEEELDQIVRAYQQAMVAIRDSAIDMQALFTAQRFGLDTSGFLGMNTGLPTDSIPVRLDPETASALVDASTAAAKELGVPVEQLVQAISLRTGGSFDPNSEGGLFGLSPELAQQLGISFGAGVQEQIEIVSNTLREAGIQAGDGFLQIVAALEAAGLAAGGEGSNMSLDEINAQGEQNLARARELLEVYGFIREQREADLLLAEEQAIRDEEHMLRKQQALEMGQFELELIGMTNEEKDRARAIRQLELEAQQRGLELTFEQLNGLFEVADGQAQILDLQWAISDAKDETIAIIDGLIEAENVVNDLLAEQEALQLAVNAAMQEGDGGRLQELQADLDAVNALLIEAQANADAMWAALAAAADLAGGGGSAVRRPRAGGGRSGGGRRAGGGGGRRAGGGGRSAGGGARTAGGGGSGGSLKDLNKEAKELAENGDAAALSWQKVVETFGQLLVNAFNDFAKAVAEGKSVGDAAREAFMKFASDFLIKIGQMIVQQAIFNALKAAFPGLGLFGGSVGVGHTGGVVGQSRVGSGNSSRSVSAMAFSGAARYHRGGIIGLRPNEVPIIAERGEEMLTRDDPRHSLNGGGTGGGSTVNRFEPRIINAFDSQDMLDQALGAPAGEEVFLNYVRKNPRKIRTALGM